MKPTLLLMPFLLTAPMYCADNANLVDLLPSDTQIVFGIRVHAVMDSEIARNITADLNGQAPEWGKMIAASGFDPLHDLDEVLVASTGAGKKAPTLIVARGTFDVAKLTPNAEDYHGVPLVVSKAKQAEGVFGFLDGTTALAGDPEMVKAAIDRRSEPAHLDSALAAQVAEYRDRYEVWAVVNRTEGLAGYMPPTDGPASALNSVDHFQFGMSLKQGLELAAAVHARTAKDAEQLAATLQFLEAMSKASQPGGAPGPKFSFKNEDGTLKVSLAISEDELKKAIENQKKAGMLFARKAMQTHPAEAAVAAPVQAAPIPEPIAIARPQIPMPMLAVPVAPTPAVRKPVAPGNGPDTSDTAVFTLPGKP